MYACGFSLMCLCVVLVMYCVMVHGLCWVFCVFVWVFRLMCLCGASGLMHDVVWFAVVYGCVVCVVCV